MFPLRRCEDDAAAQRLSTGITNFRAVCVGEKPATFTSFSPDLRPTPRTSFSVICVWPFAYTIHNAAAPFRLFANLGSCYRAFAESAEKKIQSATAASFSLLTFFV